MRAMHIVLILFIDDTSIYIPIALIGYYVYIETSAPRQGGDTARLYSPVFNSQPTKCLQFYYHMYGLHIANLTVYIKVSTSLMLMWNAAGMYRYI